MCVGMVVRLREAKKKHWSVPHAQPDPDSTSPESFYKCASLDKAIYPKHFIRMFGLQASDQIFARPSAARVLELTRDYCSTFLICLMIDILSDIFATFHFHVIFALRCRLGLSAQDPSRCRLCSCDMSQYQFGKFEMG
jgi:hypothetical protein